MTEKLTSAHQRRREAQIERNTLKNELTKQSVKIAALKAQKESGTNKQPEQGLLRAAVQPEKKGEARLEAQLGLLQEAMRDAVIERERLSEAKEQ